LGAPPGPITTRAPAKINLTLHVLGRRADGYHELESLVAFAGVGDKLTLTPGPDLALEVDGPTAPLAGSVSDNLVLKAARLLQERVPELKAGAFRLTKRLPVAAGLGGGSSDAAAALRLLARLNGLRLDHPAILDAARKTGSDVPVCLDRRARMMRGAGELLGPPLRLPRLFAVLVNPGVPVSTPAVFAALGLSPGQIGASAASTPWGDLVGDDIVALLTRARNDLEAPARRLTPEIDEAVGPLGRSEGALLVRMTGSGATTFALFPSCSSAALAAKQIRRERPNWWTKATALG
jgi:4-diphosphocytidyl-2-C-methyl-D-erythritol kinase